MTQLFLPQNGVDVSANDVTSMWRKEGKKVLHGLTVTQTNSNITISAGAAQIDGSAFNNEDDIIFDISYEPDTIYVVFLVSNRTTYPQVEWGSSNSPERYMFFPTNLIDYDDVKSVPAMTTRIVIGVISIDDILGTNDPLSFLIQNVNGLFIEPLWASIDNRTYYYPNNYKHMMAQLNPQTTFGLIVDAANFNTAVLEGELHMEGDSNITLLVACDLFDSGDFEYSLRYQESSLSMVGSSNIVLLINTATDFECRYHVVFRKFQSYLFVHGTYTWSNGKVSVLEGHMYYGTNTFRLLQLTHSGVFNDTQQINNTRVHIS